MKMFELAATKPSKQAAKVYESYFGDSINVDVISPRQARAMLNKVQKLVTEHRSTPAFHSSEKNPTYLKLMMLERVLKAKVKETATVGIGDAAGASQNTAQNAAQNAQATPNANVVAGDAAAKQKTQQLINTKFKDPKIKAAVQKSTSGQSLTTADQQLVAQAALQTESKSMRRQLYRLLRESEVQQAQVVIAAKAMVDDIQTMLEEVSTMQFKTLPPLVSEMQNQIGVDQAMQFNADVTKVLANLVQTVQAAKLEMDRALGVVTGEQSAAAPGQEPGLGDEMGLGDEPGLDDPELGAEPGLDDPELGDEPGLDDPEMNDPSMDGAGLGRAKR
jgi:hypothetical protein